MSFGCSVCGHIIRHATPICCSDCGFTYCGETCGSENVCIDCLESEEENEQEESLGYDDLF